MLRGRLVKGKESNGHFYCVNARYRPDSGCRSVRPEESRIKEIILKAAVMQMELLHEKEKKYEKIMDKEKSEILQMQREKGKISNKRKKLMDENSGCMNSMRMENWIKRSIWQENRILHLRMKNLRNRRRDWLKR